MIIDVLFAIRGLLSFVSFTEFTNAGRAICSVTEVETAGYVESKVFNGVDLSPKAERTLAHLFGLYSILNGLIILYSAVYCHYRPVVSLATAALLAKLGFVLSESLIFKSISPDQNLIFPIVSCVVALVATLFIPYITSGIFSWSKDENEELLRKMKFAKGNHKNGGSIPLSKFKQR